MANWVEVGEDRYVAQEGVYKLEVWYDEDSDPYNPGWAWRIWGPDGTDESGPADSKSEAMSIAESALPPPARRAYMAIVYEGSNGSEIPLTGPEHANLHQAEMIKVAIKEAYRAGLVGTDPHQVSEAELMKRLRLDIWVPQGPIR